MGNLQSKDIDTFLEEECPSTPNYKTQATRVLASDFDPRSPSSDITRTPIQVERTPETLLDPRSPSTDITRTPIHAGKNLQRESAPVSDVLPSEVPATPVTKEAHTAEEFFDPRSPTEGITRTPLHLKPSELDPRSPSEGITRTPLHLNKPSEMDSRSSTEGLTPLHLLNDIEGDPRSPSEDIVRTPLVFAKKSSELDPRSPSVEIDRTPICTKLADNEDLGPIRAPEELQPTKEEEEEEEEKPEEPHAETKEDLLELDAEAGAISMVKLMEALEEMKDKSVALETVPTTPTSPRDESMGLRKRKPKVLFQGNSNTGGTEGSPRSPLKAIDNTIRSPLGVKDSSRSPLKAKESGSRPQLNMKRNIDVNSPRAIVQRKQATKLNSKLSQGCAMAASSQGRTSRSPARSSSPAKKTQFQIYEDDKENC